MSLEIGVILPTSTPDPSQRIILAPTGPDWRHDYELAAKLRTAYDEA